MALGEKTKTSLEKGDILVARTATKVYNGSFAEYETVPSGQRIGFYTGINKTDSEGTLYNQIVLPISTNADKSPDFSNTKYYILAAIATNEANPNYDYVASSGSTTTKTSTDWLGTLATIFSSAGALFGIIGSKKSKQTTQQGTDTANTDTPVAETDQTWLQRNGVWVLLTGVSAMLVGGALYITNRNKPKTLSA